MSLNMLMNINFPANPTEGMVYTFDNKSWRFTLGAWSPVGTFQNLTGPTGAGGEASNTGATGAQGTITDSDRSQINLILMGS